MKLSVRNLHKSYHDANRQLTVINSLTYEFPSAGSLAIVGRSGIGKSTLLHLLGGLERPTSGEIYFDDVSLHTLSNDELTKFRGRDVGFIFQFHHLLPEFSAVENVAMPLFIGGEGEEEAMRRATEILCRVGLNERLTHRPGALSGGEQQRVAIARAVVARPKVILADEPTGNLDVETAREIQTLLLDINRELKNTLIVVTHSQDLASSLGAQLEMHAGGSLSALG